MWDRRPWSRGRGRSSRNHARSRAPGPRRSAPLLASALHVALHELLGVFLEDVVDLVKELVDVLLHLLALLGDLRTGGRPVAAALVGLGRPCFLLFLLCHVAPPWAPNRLTRRSSPRHAFILTEPPSPARSAIRGSGVSAGRACSG